MGPVSRESLEDSGVLQGPAPGSIDGANADRLWVPFTSSENKHIIVICPSIGQNENTSPPAQWGLLIRYKYIYPSSKNQSLSFSFFLFSSRISTHKLIYGGREGAKKS